MTRREEIAWAAGFYEGEGNTGKYLFRGCKKKYGLRLQVAQNNREPLDKFATIVGVGKVGGPYGPYRGQPTPNYHFHAHGENVLIILEMMWEWLSEARKTQALEAIKDGNQESSWIRSQRGPNVEIDGEQVGLL